MRIALIVIGLILAGLLAVGVLPRILNRGELKHMQQETVDAVPVVRTVQAQPTAFEETGFLPGNINAFQYASINARVDGYLKSRLVDIGDHVKLGQLLAEIETPTVDEEVAQAEADVAEAKAKLMSSRAALKESQAGSQAAAAEVEKAKADQDYASITSTRWDRMADKGAVSIQSRDEKKRSYLAQTASVSAQQAQKLAADKKVDASAAQVDEAKALLDAKQASLRHAEAKQAFKYVRAPFDGIITLRKVDPGALISAGSQSQNLELFQLAKIDDLRIYINVPQAVSRYIHAGVTADVNVPEFPERHFEGSITNISGGLDPQTRTRQTEVRVENRDHTLLPGMYAQVHLKIDRPEPWLRVNSNAIVPREDGENVVVVKDNKAHYQQVTIGRDFGDDVEIKTGLSKGDVVVVSPPVDLLDGETVSPTPLTEK